MRKKLFPQAGEEGRELGRLDIALDEHEEDEVTVGGVLEDALDREERDGVGVVDEESFSVAGAANHEQLLEVVEECCEGENTEPNPEEEVELFIENVLRKSAESRFFDNLSRIN